MFNLNSEKLTVLKWFDIVILSLILFGEGIFNSTLQYLALQDQTRTLQENLTFSALDNCKAVAIQIVWLALYYCVILTFHSGKNEFSLHRGFHYRLSSSSLSQPSVWMFFSLCPIKLSHLRHHRCFTW